MREKVLGEWGERDLCGLIKGQERVCLGCVRECVWGENWTKECVWDESKARERECVCGVRMGQD